jgi:mono/diheme cytochrome c family protein
MYVLIALDGEHGVLHPLTSQLSAAGPAAEQLDRAADFVTALVKCSSCHAYKLEGEEWVLEVRLSPTSEEPRWLH